MLIIDKNQLQIFETIKRLFLPKTEIPEKDNWKAQTNNDIWLKLITQVIVVGSSTPHIDSIIVLTSKNKLLTIN